MVDAVSYSTILHQGSEIMIHVTDKPLAAPGLISYRCRSPFGWCMIGATDHADAMREAARSMRDPKPSDLQIWDGKAYVCAFVNYSENMQ
jgi:hypothetical protein